MRIIAHFFVRPLFPGLSLKFKMERIILWTGTKEELIRIKRRGGGCLLLQISISFPHLCKLTHYHFKHGDKKKKKLPFTLLQSQFTRCIFPNTALEKYVRKSDNDINSLELTEFYKTFRHFELIYVII